MIQAKHDEIRKLWRNFVHEGVLENAGQQVSMDPAIVRSWQRCSLRLDPWSPPRLNALRADRLLELCDAHRELLALARPTIEDVHQYLEGSASILLISTAANCILDVIGDPEALDQLGGRGLSPGTYWSEELMGTNALALAQIEGAPIWVRGSEHYLSAFHDLCCSAAPIHSLSGRIVGQVGIASLYEDSQECTLALVMAAARSVTNQLQSDQFLQDANRRLTELNSVFGTISDGVISWDNDCRVTHMNRQAGEMLGLNPSTVQGRTLDQAVGMPAVLLDTVAKGGSLRDAEATLEMGDRSGDFMVNLQPILEQPTKRIGYIMTLRPLERVRRLIHRLVSSQPGPELEDIIGQSQGIQEARRRASIAASGISRVLVRGEVGVGKNLLASAIHQVSDRAQAPFVSINCAAIPAEYMLREFLGVERTSIDGEYHEGRPGKLELSLGGVVFLDDIDSLSLEMQAALIQVIETDCLMRFGGTRLIPFDVRIIAATSADLETLVEKGSFRSKLYYQLSAFSIEIPPLRDRTEDIPLLVEHFLAKANTGQGTSVELDAGAMATLMNYPWPGNSRELQSAIEQAMNNDHDGILRLEDLPTDVRSGRVAVPGSHFSQSILTIEEAEREAIIRAGWATAGHVTQMADILGVSRTTLWRRMKAMQLAASDFRKPGPRTD